MNNLPDYNIEFSANSFRIRQCSTKEMYDFAASALSAAASFANSLKDAGTDGSKDAVTNGFERVIPALPTGEYHLINYYAAKASVTAATVPNNVVPFSILESGQLLVGSSEIAAAKTRMN